MNDDRAVRWGWKICAPSVLILDSYREQKCKDYRVLINFVSSFRIKVETYSSYLGGFNMNYNRPSQECL